MKKTFLLSTVLLLWCLMALGQTTVTIGSGDDVSNLLPVMPQFRYSISQQIVHQTEIGQAGLITRIRFYMVGGIALSSSNQWTIYMGHTSLSSFISSNYPYDWIPFKELMQVHSETIQATPSAGWYEITLSNPFLYNNTDNLVIGVDENASGQNTNASYAGVWTPTGNTSKRMICKMSDSDINPLYFSNGYTKESYINRMQLVFDPPTTTPNPATIVSPADEDANIKTFATLNWHSGGGLATGYKLYFGTDNPPTNIANGTDLGFTTTFDPVTDMNYSTTYYWTIVPYNALGDATDCPVWSFTTMDNPTIVTLPHSENFDQVIAPALPAGWNTTLEATTDQASLKLSGAYSPFSSPYHIVYYNYMDGNSTLILTSPPIDANLSTLWVQFYGRCGVYGGSVIVGTMDHPLGTFTPFQTVPLTQTYSHYAIDLTTYAGTDHYIAFKHANTAQFQNIYLDNFYLQTPPSGPEFTINPTYKNYSNTFTNTTSTAQTFTFANMGTGTLTLESGSITLTGADAGQFTITDNNTYLINLTAGQTATVSVAFAPTTAGSKTANLQLVHNAAGSPTSVVLSGLALPEGSLYETFQGTWKPACWSVDPLLTWNQNTTTGYNSTKCASYYSADNTPTDIKLITPKVVVANGDQISYFAKTFEGTEQKIQIRYSADKINWTNIGGEASLTTSFAQYSTDLSSLDGQTVYLALSASSTSSYVLFYVDDVTGPQIAEPSQATIGEPADGATNVDLATNLTWGNNGQGNDPTGYKLYFGTDNPPTNLANGTNLGLVTSYDPPTDLAYNTTYYWKIVPFNDISEATGSSVWSFTTLPASATTWTGSASTDWNTAANWSNGVPGTTTEVTIPGNTSTFPTLTAAASVKQLTLQNNGSFIGAEYLATTLPSLVQRDLTANAFHFIASPVAPTTIGSILPNNQSGVYVRGYDEPTGNWTNLMAEDNTTTGMGYSVTMNAPQTALFSGTLNADPFNLTLSRQGATGGDSYVGWNLVGNPYPSALDWSAVVAANPDANFEGAAYIYSGSQYIATNGLNGGIADGLIPVGNGFFVKATANGASFNIPLAARAHSNHSIYKTTLPNNLTVAVSGNQFSDKTFIRLHNQATEGFDARWDARKLDGDEHAPQLYTLAGDYQLSINELPEKSETNIPLAVRCGSDGEFTLSFTGLESFPTNSSITLEDKLLGTTQAVDNNTSYHFTYATTHDANRFVIHLAMATGVNEINDLNTRVFYANHLLEIENNSGMKGLMTLYDMAGRPVLVQNIAEGHNQAQINQAKGIYLVRIEYATGAACFKINLMQ